MLANIELDLQLLLIRFAMNFIFNILLMIIYHKVNKNPQYLFNFLIFNILIFFLCSFLSRIELQTGLAFGLFAILSVLNYRTKPIPIKEMTFMFTSIITAAINSTLTENLGLSQIISANIVILLAISFMEFLWLRHYKSSKIILFERIDLIHEDRREELIMLLKERTGLNICLVEIQKIDFLKDTAKLKVFLE